MTKREFQFSEGTSQKFWRIALDGTSTIVEFGRIGTAGQVQTKSYADQATAQVAYDKLIAEKVRKGYSEVGANTAAASSASPPPPRLATPGTPTRAPQPASAPVPEPASIAPPALLPTDEPIRLALEPSDLLWATWRDTPPLPHPGTPAFDKEDALRRLGNVSRDIYFYSWDWTRAKIPVVPSREEAHFWLSAMQLPTETARGTSKQLATHLAPQSFDGALSQQQVLALFKGDRMRVQPVATALLTVFFTPAELCDMLLGLTEDVASLNYQISQNVGSLLDGFRSYVLPYLTADQRRELRTKIAPKLAHIVVPMVYHNSFDAAVYLAAMLGGQSPVLQRLVESWPDDRYSGEGWRDTYQRPQEIVFGLDDPRLVEYHIRRLKLGLQEPRYLRAWLAHTEFSALDYARDQVLRNVNKDEAAALVEALSCAVGPQVAPHMLELMHDSRSPQPARLWLEAHPGHTIAGLVPVAVDRGRLADVAGDMLRRLARRGYTEAINAALGGLNDEAAAKLRAAVLGDVLDNQPPLDEATAPADLRAALASERTQKQPKMPSWLRPADLPPIVIGGQALTEEHTRLLLGSLQRSWNIKPTDLVNAVRSHGEVASREACAWALFELWLADGSPSKDGWALFVLGHLGGDHTALRLAPLIRAWPGEGQHQRAVGGLECLRMIGSDTALMQINSIAQKVKFKALQARANTSMEQIATARNLSRADLEDRIVPDCDLDERGERVFDFGSRQFRFALGADLKPMIRDETGKLKTDLPKPTSKDDAVLAAQAIADWKLLKKQVGEVAKVQAVRLEQAMVTGRHWPRATFELLIVRHPLMTHLARPLIWGAYDDAATLVATFRVTEDRTYANSADDVFTLEPFATVGIVHPLHVAQRDQAAWGEVLSDYELVPPFQQLGRPIYQLDAVEQTATDITRFNQLTIPAASLVFGLDKQGWRRDAPADGGGFNGHFKPFYQANVTAVVQYDEGVGVGYIVDAPDQKVRYLAFVPGLRAPEYWPRHNDRLALHTVDPVVISEALNDLTIVMAKAK
ncbi:MAG: DUF4132 domain-containing protein [Roseiflexaceae bacterium]|nr:DUF4132 domain-containing protein [Roseiflexaceae bacterium]